MKLFFEKRPNGWTLALDITILVILIAALTGHLIPALATVAGGHVVASLRQISRR